MQEFPETRRPLRWRRPARRPRAAVLDVRWRRRLAAERAPRQARPATCCASPRECANALCSWPTFFRERVVKPGAGRIPVVDDGAHRHTKRFRGFLNGEPTKESQLDDLARPRVKRRQFTQGVVQRDDVHAGCRRRDLAPPRATSPPPLDRAWPPVGRARRPPGPVASSGRWWQRSAHGSASEPRASRAGGRRTPARDRWVATQWPGARPTAAGEPSPEARDGRAARAVPGPPRHRRSTPAATQSHRRSRSSSLPRHHRRQTPDVAPRVMPAADCTSGR